MYYKVLKNGRVIDALDHLRFVKYQPKHDIMVNCVEDDAQGIISSDGNHICMWTGIISSPAPSMTPWNCRKLTCMNMSS